MKLPKIETFYKLKQNELDKSNNSKIIPEEKYNNNYKIISSSNNKFDNIYYPTKYIPRILTALKLSDNYFKIKDNFLNWNFSEIKKENKDIFSKEIKSYRRMLLPKKYNKIKCISSKMKKNNDFKISKINKKINIIKSSDNLFLNNDINTNNNNLNGVNSLLDNKFQNSIQLQENKNPNKDKEKDEDKTILPFSTKILNQKKMNILNIRGFKYSDIIYYRNEGNKELIKKKTFEHNTFDNKKYHEHYIFFNNSFIRNNSWKNHVLKNILQKNLNIMFKEKNLKKNAINNAQLSQELEKKNKKEKNKLKKFNIFRNIYNNNYINSFFNSEINNFYNNYKNRNDKFSLSKRNDIINKNSNIINFTRIHNNIIYNFYTPKKRLILNYNLKHNINSKIISYN